MCQILPFMKQRNPAPIDADVEQVGQSVFSPPE
jgi:hypothetical protein